MDYALLRAELATDPGKVGYAGTADLAAAATKPAGVDLVDSKSPTPQEQEKLDAEEQKGAAALDAAVLVADLLNTTLVDVPVEAVTIGAIAGCFTNPAELAVLTADHIAKINFVAQASALGGGIVSPSNPLLTTVFADFPDALANLGALSVKQIPRSMKLFGELVKPGQVIDALASAKSQVENAQMVVDAQVEVK